MVQDIYKISNQNVDYLSIIKDFELMGEIDDSIFSNFLFPSFKGDKFNCPEAAELIHRIYSRDLYKFVGEIFVTENIDVSKISSSEIVKYAANNVGSPSLREEDIIVKVLLFSYGNGSRDPLENAKFYKNKTERLIDFNKDDYLLDRPYKFEEKLVRIYVKSKTKFLSALGAFTNFCQEKIGNARHEYDKAMSAKKIKDYASFTFQKEKDSIDCYLNLKEDYNSV